MKGRQGFYKAYEAWFLEGKRISVKTGECISVYDKNDREEFLSFDGHAIDFSVHDIEYGDWFIN
jgi:hypothetical protein